MLTYILNCTYIALSLTLTLSVSMNFMKQFELDCEYMNMYGTRFATIKTLFASVLATESFPGWHTYVLLLFYIHDNEVSYCRLSFGIANQSKHSLIDIINFVLVCVCVWCVKQAVLLCSLAWFQSISFTFI